MKFLVFGCSLFLSGAAAWGQDWVSLDARSRALGGAGVAFADGRGESAYWNPASLAVGAEKPLDFSTGFAFSISAFADAHVTGNVAADVNRIVDAYDFFNFLNVQSNFNATPPTVNATDLQNVLQIVDALSRLNDPGEGVLLHAGGSFNLRVGPFGLFVNAIGNVGAAPVVDLTGVGFSTNSAFFSAVPTATPHTPTSAESNLSLALQTRGGLTPTVADNLAFQAQQGLGDAAISNPAFVNSMVALAQGTGNPTDLYNSPSGVFLRALAQVEAGVSFALPLFPTLLDVGVSFKEIISETSFRFLSYAEQDSGTDIGEAIRDDLLKKNRVRSTNFNMDLGARAMPLEWLTMGLSVRNLIPMNIKYGGPGRMHMDPQVRFGAMASALGFLKLGVDVDVLENESPVLPGYKTRNVGVGLEFDLPVLKIRIGYADNLAFASDHGRLTAGIGFDILGFVLDIGAQMSLNEITVEKAKLDGSESARTFFADRVAAGITLGINLPF
jgi:hypothetical protein